MRGLAGSIKGPWLKLEWARHHQETLDWKVSSYLSAYPCRLVRDPNTEPALYIFRAYSGGPIDPDIGLILADVIHNLRASLDQLVWELASIDGHVPPPNIQFPIYLKREGPNSYKTHGAPRIAGLPREAQELIEALQPYHRGERDQLWILQQLWNLDKHRLTPLVYHWNETGIISNADPSMSIHYWHFGPFEDGEPVLEYTLGPDAKSEPEPQPTFGVAFDKEGPAAGSPLSILLPDLHHHVRFIFEEIEPLFP